MDGEKRILAIETSGRHGSVALLTGTGDQARVAKQIVLGGDERTAQVLAPSIQTLLNEMNWAPASVDLVAVVVGPGSFTGLRIGVTTAKTFAYATNAELIGVNTLEVIATQVPKAEGRLWTVLDAQRQELFAASFSYSQSGEFTSERETSIIPQTAWLVALQSGDRVSGPALTRIVPKLPDGINVVSQAFWQPLAESVGELAWKNFQAGQRDDVWELVPQYYRSSAAEEKSQKARLE